MDWQCKCHEGREQSPIDLRRVCQLPGKKKLTSDFLNKSAIFEFYNVKSDDYDIIYDENIIKIKCNKGYSACKEKPMAKVVDVDYNEFYTTELRFHTPSEHTIEFKEYHMEIQAIFEPLTQDAFRDKLILAWLVENKPGGMNDFMAKINLLDLPHKKFPKKKISDEN